MICSCQELRRKVVRASYKRLALHFANHRVCPALADLYERLFYLCSPLALPLLIAQQPLLGFNVDSLVGQLAYLGKEHRATQHPPLHFLAEARVELWLPNVIVKGSPSCA